MDWMRMEVLAIILSLASSVFATLEHIHQVPIIDHNGESGFGDNAAPEFDLEISPEVQQQQPLSDPVSPYMKRSEQHQHEHIDPGNYDPEKLFPSLTREALIESFKRDFHIYDKDKNGEVDIQDIQSIHNEMTHHGCQLFIEEGDEDKSGTLCVHEYITLMLSHTNQDNLKKEEL